MRLAGASGGTGGACRSRPPGEKTRVHAREVLPPRRPEPEERLAFALVSASTSGRVRPAGARDCGGDPGQERGLVSAAVGRGVSIRARRSRGGAAPAGPRSAAAMGRRAPS